MRRNETLWCNRHHRLKWWATILCASTFGGCTARDRTPGESIATAWQRSDRITTRPAETDLHPTVEGEVISPGGSQTLGAAIATVNNRPIPRRRLVELLLQSHGAAVLEQLIGLETAAMAAAESGVIITGVDVGREYDRALQKLAGPLSSLTPAPLVRQEAERLLETVLLERGVAREEFNLIMQRNAYLRKIVEAGTVIADRQLREEFNRLYGRRAQVRHIQLATLGELEHVKARLAAGEDFGKLAHRYSANVASARVGGLLDPFSAEDDSAPPLFREVAFSLDPDEVSSAVRVGEWYHLIKVERVFPAEEHDFESVRLELERSLRERIAEPAMYELFENLFEQANIEIHDPALRTAFQRKHPGRAR